MDVRALLQAFATVFPAELPDKTMIATIVLVARYRRPGWVWLGAVAAFSVHVVVAVTAGHLIGLAPKLLVRSIVTLLFLTGAVLLFRAGREAERALEDEAEDEPEPTASAWATVAASFGVIVLAEWGDLTQLAMASLAAKSSHPLSIGLGSFVALACVAAIAATFGRQLVARVSLHKVNYVGAAVFLALAVWTFLEIVA